MITRKKSSEVALGGRSLVPVLKNPPVNGTHTLFPYAFSQFPRCDCTYQTNQLDTLNGTCNATYINKYTHETGATRFGTGFNMDFLPSQANRF